MSISPQPELRDPSRPTWVFRVGAELARTETLVAPALTEEVRAHADATRALTG